MLPLKTTYLVTALAASAVLTGCGIGEASVAEQAERTLPIPVDVAYPRRESIAATYDTTATITTDLDALAIAKVGGEVVAIHVEEGEMVRQGQVLATLDGERLRLEMLSAKAELEHAERDFERNTDLHARGLISASMFDGMKYNLEAMEAKYTLAALLYDDSNIRAPINGVVASRAIKLGQNLQVNEQAFRVINTSKLLAYLKIPQSELSKFAAGNLATLKVASLPDTVFVAEVDRVSPTIDKTNGTFRVTALIDNTVGLLAPGMFAHFSIAYERHENALTIPTAAIVEEDAESVVYVVKKHAVERRVVETGIVFRDVTEVLNGLNANESVVIVGQSSLADGTRVLAQTITDDNFIG